MFSKVALFTIASAVFVAAAPTNISQCNTGNAQCCNSVQRADDPSMAQLLGLLGVAAQGVDALVGIDCLPLVNVVGGANCAQQPVCCSGNNFNGLVNVGCTPISI